MRREQIKKIVFLTNGTRGDIQPLCCLGVALQEKGYDPVLITSDNFKSLVEGFGLKHSTMPVNLQEFMNTEEGKQWVRKKLKNPFVLLKSIKDMTKSLSAETLEAYWAAAQGASCLVTTPGAIGDVIMARHLGIPLIEVQLQPLVPTKTFSYPLLPIDPALGILRKSVFLLMEQLLWMMFKKDIRQWEVDIFSSRMKLKCGIFFQRRRECASILGAYSPSLVSRPSDWPDKALITGFLTLSGREANPALDENLSHFIKEGRPPVYMGFGSMPLPEKSGFTELVNLLLDNTEERIVICSGWSDADQFKQNPRLCIIAEADQRVLFPLCSFIIHHGGAGTTAAALYAGKPQMVFPFTADQPFWAKRLKALGVAPPAYPLKRISRKKLMAAYHYVCDNKTLSIAGTIARRINREKGVGVAADLIDSLI